MAVPSVLCQEPPTPDSPQASLVHSALLLPEPTVSGCKWNFVHWPFKSFLCLLLSLAVGQKPCCFSQPCYCGSFLGFWCCRLRSPARAPYFSEATPQPLKYPSSTSAAACGSQPALSYLLCSPYQSHCIEVASFICLWFLSSWCCLFFRVIFL